MSTTDKPTKKKGYTSVHGSYYKDVTEIAYQKSDMFINMGKLVAETRRETDSSLEWSNYEDRGVYIFESVDNPKVAYRIYNEYANDHFNGYMDDELIQKLSEVKEKVKLSKLPSGLVTLEGRIIGQEIPYFPNAVTLEDFSKNTKNITYHTKIYKEVLRILEELYEHGIIYLDCHSNNFLINLDSDDVKIEIIDFDPVFIKFRDHNKTFLLEMLHNYRSMIEYLNHNFAIKDITGPTKKTETFESTMHVIEEMEKKLIKK